MKRPKSLTLTLLVIALATLVWASPGWCQVNSEQEDTFPEFSVVNGDTTFHVDADLAKDLGDVVLGKVDSTANLALGAVAKDNNDIAALVTVGDIGEQSTKNQWNTKRTDNIGRYIDIDLDMEVGVQRVVIKAGYYLISSKKPEFYIKGYRVSVAPGDDPGVWVAVAEQPDNGNTDVDTSVDGTWLRTDRFGTPVATIGRYVRVEIITEDGESWVVIGEIEVYGTGYKSSGYYTSPAMNLTKADFGKVVWEADIPQGTSIALRFRSSTDGVAWDRDWEDALPIAVTDSTGSAMIDVTEGQKAGSTRSYAYIQYRAHLQTTLPSLTPRLKSVKIEYDNEMASTAAFGSISPDSTRIWDGSKTLSQRYTYTADLTMRSGDRGVKQLKLLNVPGADVDSVRVDGTWLEEAEYTWQPDGANVDVVLVNPITTIGSDSLQVVFTVKLLSTDTRVRSQIASDYTPVSEDDYVNFQSLQESEQGDDTWTVTMEGIPPNALPVVAVEPNPFNPVSGTRRTAAFICDVAKINVERKLTISVFTLSGKRVRTWSGMIGWGSSLGGQWQWDGKDEDGDLVLPGLYVYQAVLESDEPSVKSGLIGVAY